MNYIINNLTLVGNGTTLLNLDKTTISNYVTREDTLHNVTNNSDKKIKLVKQINHEAYTCSMVGGKASNLYRMQQVGMLVPEFTTINICDTATLEKHVLDIKSLQPFIADIINFNLSQITITNIKQAIETYYDKQPEKRSICLQGLAKFIASDAFYNQVINSQIANVIRKKYDQLIANLPQDSAIIVRSSGINEDNYGNAQAGKFASIVQGQKDILRTCLQVLASGFLPNVCQFSSPRPMALILQRCIDCSFSGVAMSRTSQNDSRCKIEYTQGQPKGVVSGLAGVTPHCYLALQQEDKFTYEFTFGNITSKFILNEQDINNFTETQVAVAKNSSDVYLTDEQLQQVYQYLQKGENMLLCPADIEFAIAQNGSVYIVQLRPLTVLTGGMNFAIEAPENPLATGALVSEGFCSGKLYCINNLRDAQKIPQDAIIAAEHGTDWMLTTNFLEKVSGFIFSQGGTNDHVAITLRQQEKPCLICKDKFIELKNNNNEVITLACCSFNGTSGAYVVNGSKFADKLANMQSVVNATYKPRSSSKPIRTTPELKFDSPDIAFKNLNNLNYRLLDYFSSDSWLSRCFSEKGMVALSMTPHRIEIIKEAKQEIEQLFTDFKLFLDGYKQFLQLGIKPQQDDKKLQEELHYAELLENKFEQIKTEVNNSINNISQQFIELDNQTTIKGDFNKLLQDAINIHSYTGKFNLAKRLYMINSIHDCIFWLHKRFVNAISVVSSGLGTIAKHKEVTSITFFNVEGQQEIAKACIDALQTTAIPQVKVVVMQNAIIATASLGIHVFTVEMSEQAEASKGRTLTVKLSDDFINYNRDNPGKLKRFCFFTQLLHNINFAKNANEMQVSIEEATGMLVIEVSNIKTKNIMLAKFLELLPILEELKNMDYRLDNLPSFNKEIINWNFSVLKQKLANIASLENQQCFKHTFIMLSLLNKFPCNFEDIATTDQLQTLLSVIESLKDKNNATTLEIQTIVNKIDGINQENFLYDLLAANITVVAELAKARYPNWFTDEKTFSKLLAANGLLLQYASLELINKPKIVLTAVSQNVTAFKYVGAKFTTDAKFMLHCIININVTAIKYVDKNIAEYKSLELAARKKHINI